MADKIICFLHDTYPLPEWVAIYPVDNAIQLTFSNWAQCGIQISDWSGKMICHVIL